MPRHTRVKRIGIDARLVNQTGVGRYTRNLLSHLVPLIDHDVEVYIYALVEDAKTLTFNHPRVTIRTTRYRWHGVGEQVGFFLQLMFDKLDLMHFTYFSFPMLYRRPFIMTIHDLTHVMHATGKASTKSSVVYALKHAAYLMVLRAGVQNSRAIITPTHTVKDMITAHFGAAVSSKIHVTYEGVGSDLIQAEAPRTSPFTQPYMMYVGNFYPHKNVSRLVEAFARIKTDAILVLYGPDDYFAHTIRREIARHEQEERILMVHGATDAQLAHAYEHAVALIQPSLAEGFGLQLLEASYFHCPVIASHIPIFDEIMGTSYVAFDPLDIYDIASKIQSFLAKPSKTYLSRKEINKRFSFEKMTKQTYELYSNILAHT